jgi:hypothetical protein
MATFPTDEQIKGESEDLFNSIKSGKLEPKGQKLNMSKILQLFTTDLQKYHFRQIEKPQRAQALLAFEKVLKVVILKANLIISTNNNVRDALISTNFRDKDKDPKETEPSTLLPFKLQASHNINAIILYGDNAQLSPLITGLQAKERFNKFGQQLRLSFITGSQEESTDRRFLTSSSASGPYLLSGSINAHTAARCNTTPPPIESSSIRLQICLRRSCPCSTSVGWQAGSCSAGGYIQVDPTTSPRFEESRYARLCLRVRLYTRRGEFRDSPERVTIRKFAFYSFCSSSRPARCFDMANLE